MSKKQNICNFSTVCDSTVESVVHTAKISNNSSHLATIKLKRSKRVLQNRPHHGSALCRVSDELSLFSQSGMSIFSPLKKIHTKSAFANDFQTFGNQNSTKTQELSINSSSKGSKKLSAFGSKKLGVFGANPIE